MGVVYWEYTVFVGIVYLLLGGKTSSLYTFWKSSLLLFGRERVSQFSSILTQSVLIIAAMTPLDSF